MSRLPKGQDPEVHEPYISHGSTSVSLPRAFIVYIHLKALVYQNGVSMLAFFDFHSETYYSGGPHK